MDIGSIECILVLAVVPHFLEIRILRIRPCGSSKSLIADTGTDTWSKPFTDIYIESRIDTAYVRK